MINDLLAGQGRKSTIDTFKKNRLYVKNLSFCKYNCARRRQLRPCHRQWWQCRLSTGNSYLSLAKARESLTEMLPTSGWAGWILHEQINTLMISASSVIKAGQNCGPLMWRRDVRMRRGKEVCSTRTAKGAFHGRSLGHLPQKGSGIMKMLCPHVIKVRIWRKVVLVLWLLDTTCLSKSCC